ncbi:hypothetical protein [Vulgatibacter sp.]|uniref:hypothetical protein n=1 Tax=Vulgatibacter sp. TaxID=1971226 RepID=UPI003563B8E1
METLPALLTVAGSYAGYLLALRRVRVYRGRKAGPSLELLRRYDHVALAGELSPVRAADDTTATGPRLVPVPSGPVGTLPAIWAEAPWSFAAPTRLAAAREELLLGLPAEAAAQAAGQGAPPEAVRSLFTWAFLHRLFGGELAMAREIAEALRTLDPGAGSLVHRLLARLEAVRAEVEPGATEAAAAAGLEHLRRGAVRGLPAPPAEAGLVAHFEVLRLTLWELEWRELAVRRQLRRAQARHPQAPVLHLVRAHLAAVLGDGPGAADHLARALYYARGDAFYARPVAASPYLARVRPALVAEARGLLDGARQQGGGESIG